MKPALLLVDLQNDFLARQPLEPAPELLVARAATLLGHCRRHGVRVVHVRMSVTRHPDNRLPQLLSLPEWSAARSPGERS